MMYYFNVAHFNTDFYCCTNSVLVLIASMFRFFNDTIFKCNVLRKRIFLMLH